MSHIRTSARAMRSDRRNLVGLIGIGLVATLGCGAETTEHPAAATSVSEPAATPATDGLPSEPAADGAAPIQFKDNVATNVEVPQGLQGLTFFDTKGHEVALRDYVGKKNVVLVFTEGFAGMLCPFCKAQTSALVANYDRFSDLDTEILVVYPGTRDHLDEFVEAAKTHDKRQVERVPFPIVLDEEMSAVDFFDIRSQLAHPSTYVINKRGDVSLAYVGADMSADRPSVDALLNTLRSANEQGP